MNGFHTRGPFWPLKVNFEINPVLFTHCLFYWIFPHVMYLTGMKVKHSQARGVLKQEYTNKTKTRFTLRKYTNMSTRIHFKSANAYVNDS